MSLSLLPLQKPRDLSGNPRILWTRLSRRSPAGLKLFPLASRNWIEISELYGTPLPISFDLQRDKPLALYIALQAIVGISAVIALVGLGFGFLTLAVGLAYPKGSRL